MSPPYGVTPADRCTITTTVRINRSILTNLGTFASEHHIIKGYREVPAGPFDRLTRRIQLNLLQFRGIRVTLTPVDRTGLSAMAIDFNPGICLYGHNGRILPAEEFVDALSVLPDSLICLLKDPDDWLDLVPGLRLGSPAFWSYLEIASQCHDPDGEILRCFRNARHPSITRTSRHWQTSMLLQGCKLGFSIYLKACEMAERGKLSTGELETFRDILRLEVRLLKEKLPHYLGGPRNTAIIDGEERLVRFLPKDIVHAHRTTFEELQGVFRAAASNTTSAPAKRRLTDQGRLIAMIASHPRATKTVGELLRQLRLYCGASDSTLREIRKAAFAELSAGSSLTYGSLFPDSTNGWQPNVISAEREEKVCHFPPSFEIRSLIEKTYLPQNQPFQPHIHLPSYFRHA